MSPAAAGGDLRPFAPTDQRRRGLPGGAERTDGRRAEARRPYGAWPGV